MVNEGKNIKKGLRPPTQANKKLCSCKFYAQEINAKLIFYKVFWASRVLDGFGRQKETGDKKRDFNNSPRYELIMESTRLVTVLRTDHEGMAVKKIFGWRILFVEKGSEFSWSEILENLEYLTKGFPCEILHFSHVIRWRIMKLMSFRVLY